MFLTKCKMPISYSVSVGTCLEKSVKFNLVCVCWGRWLDGRTRVCLPVSPFWLVEQNYDLAVQQPCRRTVQSDEVDQVDEVQEAITVMKPPSRPNDSLIEQNGGSGRIPLDE